jgi:hypothetical protein
LHYTFTDSWDYLFNYYKEIQKERIKPDTAIKKLVDKIKNNVSNDTELMEQLYYWIENNIRYISIKSSRSSGWAGHPASETLKNGFGDCTDVSMLYCAMLNYAGIEAYPVILNTNDAGKLTTEIPVPDGNHCITQIHYNNRVFYIDPTTSTYRFPYLRIDDNGVKCVNYIKGKIYDIPVSKPEHNAKNSVIEIKIKNVKQADIKITNYYTGPYEASIRNSWRHIKQEQVNPVMQNYVSNIDADAVLKDFFISDLYDLSKQIYMIIKYNTENIFEQAGNLYLFEIPTFEKQFNELVLEKREYELEYMSPYQRENKFIIYFPENLKLESVPENLHIDNEFIYYKSEFNIKNNKISLYDNFKLKKRIIKVSEYTEFKTIMNKIYKYTQNRLFFKK